MITNRDSAMANNIATALDAERSGHVPVAASPSLPSVSVKHPLPVRVPGTLLSARAKSGPVTISDKQGHSGMDLAKRLECAVPNPPGAFPSIIKVGVTAIILTDAGILLGVKNRPAKYAGMIVTPGGKLNFGEPWAAGMKREALEETGLQIAIIRQLPTLELIDRDEHIVFLCFEAVPCGGHVVAGDDLDSVHWCPLDRLANCRLHMTPLTRQLLADYF